MAQDEFVDLYKILEVSPEADEATLKKRISEKYLEAQRNLDHRNAKKRLEYQQLYQIYLPEARHLLLDATHRAEYDRYWQAFRSGKAVAPLAPAAVSPASQAHLPSTDDGFHAMDGGEADPQKLAAQREQLWNKWKSGLELPAASPAPVASTRQSVAAPVAAVAEPEAPRRPKRKIWAKPNDEAEVAKRRQEQAERESARANVKQVTEQAETARKTYGIGGGVLFLVTVLPFYLFFFKGVLTDPLLRFFADSSGKPGGEQAGTAYALLNYVFPIVIVVSAYFFSQWASDFGYHRTFAQNGLKSPSPGDRLNL